MGANPVPVKKHCGWSCKVGKVGGFLKKHQATIAGLAAGGICLAASGGTGTLGCAAVAGWVYGAVSYHQNTPADQQTLLGGFKASLTGAVIEVGLTLTGMKAAKIVAPLAKRVAPKIIQRIAGRAKGGAPGRGGSAAKTAPAAAKNAGKAADDAPASGGGGGGCPLPNSFVPGTTVLMADGTAKPIDNIKVGDKVLATDPITGKTSAQLVQATITGTGAKHLVQLTVDTDGKHGDETGVLIATDNHPFWVPAASKWIDAGKLKPGMWLRTSAGTHVQLTATKIWTQYQRVHNLTVETDHTYYALAGGTPLLVHNCNSGDPLMEYAEEVRNEPGVKFASEYTSPSGQKYYGRNRHGQQAEGPLADAIEEVGHHGGCAEVHCLIQAQEVEGPSAIRGGTMRTVQSRNNSMPNSNPDGHGEPGRPCGACGRLLKLLNIG